MSRKYNLDFNRGSINFELRTLEQLRDDVDYVSERWSWNSKSLYLLFKGHAVIYHINSNKYVIVDLELLDDIDSDKLNFYDNGNGYFKADIPMYKKLDGYSKRKIYLYMYVLLKRGIRFEGKQVHHINTVRADNRFKNLIALDEDVHKRSHRVLEVCAKEYIKFISLLRSGYSLDNELEVTVVRKADSTFFALVAWDSETSHLHFTCRDELDTYLKDLIEEKDLGEYVLSTRFVKSSYILGL